MASLFTLCLPPLTRQRHRQDALVKRCGDLVLIEIIDQDVALEPATSRRPRAPRFVINKLENRSAVSRGRHNFDREYIWRRAEFADLTNEPTDIARGNLQLAIFLGVWRERAQSRKKQGSEWDACFDALRPRLDHVRRDLPFGRKASIVPSLRFRSAGCAPLPSIRRSQRA